MIPKPFFVRDDKKLKKINPYDVIFISAERNYTRIFLADTTNYMVRSPLSKALQKLPSDIFIRIHRSHAASIYYIDDITRDHLVIGDESIAIGKQYYKSLVESLNIIE